MPYIKISELPAVTTPLAGTELLEIVQGGVSKQVNAADLVSGGPPPFDVHVFVPGLLTDAMLILSVPLARAVTFPADFAGSYSLAVAATAETILTIKKNGTEVGTITFAISGAVGVWASTGGLSVSFAAEDLLSIHGQATADVTLSDVGLVMAGTR